MTDYRLEPDTRFPELELAETPGFVRGEWLEVPMPFGSENEPQESQLRQRATRRHLTRRAIQRRLDRLKADGLGEYLNEPWVLKRARGNYRRNIDQREWLQRREMRREARNAPGPQVPRWRKLRPRSRTRKAKPFRVLCYWRWSLSGDPWRTSRFSYATLRGAEDAAKAFAAQRYFDRVEIVHNG